MTDLVEEETQSFRYQAEDVRARVDANGQVERAAVVA
jgi:hypothetical protein